jgi:hypothetical protein
MKNDQNKLCPSYYAKPGAKLYGIVNGSGFIDYLQSTIEIDETFISEANKGRAPEKRFRFAGNCAKNGCKQWNGKGKECGLIDKIIEIVDNAENSDLQHCPIREKCRWFAQKQGLACAQCNEIIRNIESKSLEMEEA